MRLRLGRGVIAVAACGLAACASIIGLGDYEVTDERDAPAETSVVDVVTNEAGAMPSDGGTPDTGPPPPLVCTLLVDDDFKTPDARWVTEGTAKFENDQASLVPANINQRGAIVMQVPAELSPAVGVIATFTMKYDKLVTSKPADGVAFYWASDTTLPPLGGTGGNVSFCPGDQSDGQAPMGQAVALTLFPDAGASTRESDGKTCVYGQLIPLSLGSPVVTTVTVERDHLSVKVTTASGGGGFGTSFKPVPIRWVGLSAATGGSFAPFAVDDVKIEVCR